MDSPHHHEDHPHVVSRNARYGLWLFAVYFVLYGGFIFLVVFQTPLMGEAALGGMNLAIVYGLGLIAAALVLALIYVRLCRGPVGRGTREDRG